MGKEEEMENLINTNDMMKYFKITRTTIERWRKDGLPTIPVGVRSVRFKLSDVLIWLETNKKQ